MNGFEIEINKRQRQNKNFPYQATTLTGYDS